MHRQIYLIATAVLVLSLCAFGCENNANVDEPVVHVSKRVKIERPEKPSDTAEKKPAGQAEKQAAETAPKTPAEQHDEQTAAAEKPKATQEKAAAKDKPAPEKESAPETAEKTVPSGAEKSEDASMAEQMEAEQTDLLGGKERYYVKKGRVDPFEPFLHKPENEQPEKEGERKIQRRKPRTPLERIAINQLKLTAVMRLTSDQQAMALVEDANSKGYIVREDTYIGEKGGRVSQIKQDKIIIEEKYKDVFGKVALRKIELKLQKRPGE